MNSAITVRPVYDCKRASQSQLFGIYIDNKCVVITCVYPSWVTESITAGQTA